MPARERANLGRSERVKAWGQPGGQTKQKQKQKILWGIFEKNQGIDVVLCVVQVLLTSSGCAFEEPDPKFSTGSRKDRSDKI